MRERFVFTNEKNCMGCNKCIFACPTNANKAFFHAEECKVFIKDGFCISCGECLNICDHNARDFHDDLIDFFEDLSKGEKISVIIAPAVRFNFPNTKKLIAYLKHIGVHNVYDVSFGADICTWAHVKLMKEEGLSGIISQPCPVVVSYIEKYKPKLIKNLSPIQSPAVCMATYMKSYLNFDGKIMFLSPCIGKKRECIVEETHGMMNYNITFKKFSEYLNAVGVDLDTYPESNFDIIDGSLGFAFARPGGLNENIKYHLGQDIWIKQIEGIKKIGRYFDEYIRDAEAGRSVPTLVDALNCEHGCNLGTGTKKSASLNEIDFVTNTRKREVDRDKSDKLLHYFENTLNISDFIRHYKDRSSDYERKRDIDLDRAFISLGKYTAQDRTVNCFSCGYGNCHDFAYDLAMGNNDRNNCRHYLLNKFRKLSLYDELTGAYNRHSYSLEIAKFKETHPRNLGIIFVDINGLKQVNDLKGHSYGDEMIISCANIMKSVFDKKVYRIGGDEFIVLDPVNDLAHFEQRLEQFYFTVKSQDFVSLSIGSAVSTRDEDLDSKLVEADKLMYQSKQEYYASFKTEDRRSRSI